MSPQRRELEVVRSRDEGDILGLRLLGTLTEISVASNHDPLPGALGSSGYAGKVLFDLSGIDLLDCSGYSWLLKQHCSFRNAGGALALHSVPPQVMLVLTTVRGDLVFRIAADEAAAIQLLRGSHV
jgi:anti-anti-sigma regulatory factor